jgi:hypothetical protein
LKDSIFIYKINNDDFRSILDTFINHEKQYKYFNKNVTLFLNILDSNGTCLQLSSGLIQSTLSIMEYDTTNCGVFYYDSIRFLISGRSPVDERIFKKGSKKVAVLKIKIEENENAIENDKYFPTYWIYKYSNAKFYSTWKSDRIEKD